MTTETQAEGASVGTIIVGLVVIGLVAVLVWGFVTDWHMLDYRLSFVADQPVVVSVTPEATATPWPTETPAPTAAPVSLAPYSNDEAHIAYRQAFNAMHRNLMEKVGILRWLTDEWAGSRGGSDEWLDIRLRTCNNIRGLAQDWVVNVWPPGPYDASNSLLDAHARITAAQTGAVVACENLGQLGAHDYYFKYPSAERVNEVRGLLQTVGANLDYALAGYTLDLYGTR